MNFITFTERIMNRIVLTLVCLYGLILGGDAAAATGTISTDSPCQMGLGQSTCTVQIAASKSGTPIACIWATESTQLISCEGHSSWNTYWSWATVGGRVLQLRAHSSFPNQDPGWPGNKEQIFSSAPLLDETLIFGLADTPRPLNIAHRGNESEYLENSLLAFISAKDVGADMVELDVRRTQDGVPIVYHNSIFSNKVECSITGITGMSVSNIQFQDIRQYCNYQPNLIGNPNLLPTQCQIYPADQILTFREALDVLHCLDIAILIELKDQSASEVFSDLQNHAAMNPVSGSCTLPFNCMNNVFVQSFSNSTLQAFDAILSQPGIGGFGNIWLILLVGPGTSPNLLNPAYAYLWQWDGVAFDYGPFGEDILYEVNLMRIEYPSKWISVYTATSSSDLGTLNQGALDGIINSIPAQLYLIQN